MWISKILIELSAIDESLLALLHLLLFEHWCSGWLTLSLEICVMDPFCSLSIESVKLAIYRTRFRFAKI